MRTRTLRCRIVKTATPHDLQRPMDEVISYSYLVTNVPVT